jgi:general secretion pathway protein D
MVTMALAEEPSPKAPKGDNTQVVRQVVDNWVQIATEQYRRGFYAAAEKSFLQAKDYEKYLTAAERDKLNDSLQQAHKAAIERENALAAIRSADELAGQQKFAEAKTRLQSVQTSVFLTDEERQLIKKRLEAMDKEPGAQQKQAAAPAAQPQVVQQVEPAPVAEQPKGQPPTVPAEVKEAAEPAMGPTASAQNESVAAGTGEPAQEQTGYIGVINRRRSIIRGRTKAVVNDTAAKAQGFISQGQFDKAQEAVETAEKVVYENQQQLGDYLFNQYSGQLKQLSDKIAEGQKLQAQQKEEAKRAQAEQAQKEYKDKMTTDREKRVADLYQNAVNFQKQQRYKDALGQLELLLTIDPQHNEALILKQTLEDMVSFQEQLAIEKEKNKERVGITMKTEEAAIPYADEMVYPKNWREINAKSTRREKEATGQDPANAALVKQLDEIVDLPGLSPEMPLREAIRLLENSVSPPLKISVNWGDLYNNANIDQTTAINMDPLTGIRLGAALDLLLKSVSAGVTKLGYIVKDGVVNVATQQSLPPEMEARVYDVTILVGRPADYYVSSNAGTGGGGGAGGGGGGGGGNQFFQEQFEETEQNIDAATLRQEAIQRMDSLITLIQDTVDPTSWFDAGGDATITRYETKKLVVMQTLKNHRDIEKLLKDMREALGHQVSIEARFLVVGENFLEEIGLDMWGNVYLGKHLGTSQWQADSFDLAYPEPTGIAGSFGYPDPTKGVQFPPNYPPSNPQTMPAGALMGFFGGKFGGILDDLEANFLIRATQAHRDTESLVAPKVTVLSGESATLQVVRTIRYPVLPNLTTSGTTGGLGGAGGGSSFNQQYGSIPTGPTLNITPTITPDKKHVLLNIVAELQDFLGFEPYTVEVPALPGVSTTGTAAVNYSYQVTLPQTERSRVRTRVNVPDGGTLLLGGLKRSAGAEKEVGVPILSKIPIIGRAFTNRSKVADQRILLILVKPTIMLQEETDSEAIAAMEGQL